MYKRISKDKLNTLIDKGRDGVVITVRKTRDIDEVINGIMIVVQNHLFVNSNKFIAPMVIRGNMEDSVVLLVRKGEVLECDEQAFLHQEFSGDNSRVTFV